MGDTARSRMAGGLWPPDRQCPRGAGLDLLIARRCVDRAGLTFARRFRSLTAKRPDPAARLIADRMIGSMLHYVGDQTKARRRIERMLSRYVDPLHRSHTIRFVWDQRVAGEIILAAILW